MAITDADFDNEKELETWVVENLNLFLGDVVYLPPCRIQTFSGKGGIPDGRNVSIGLRQPLF